MKSSQKKVLAFVLSALVWVFWLTNAGMGFGQSEYAAGEVLVKFREDGVLEWVALARRVRMLPEDVREIGPDRFGSMGFLAVVHSGPQVRFLNQITGFHEVLLHIKNRHPAVVLKGC